MAEELQFDGSYVKTVGRTLYVVGTVDPSLTYQFVVQFEALAATEGDIRIVLNSEGGDEQEGYAIYDTIMMAKNKVTIDGYGSVMSIAAIIFQAADVRRLAPNAQFLIHNGTVNGTDQTVGQTQIMDLAEQIKRDSERYYQILAIRSKQPREVIEEWCRGDATFSAQEAIDEGFSDEVIEHVKKFNKRGRKKK